jgi:RNA methyltransferase, TrmH family
VITSVHNERVARAVRLGRRSAREAERRFLVEGERGVRDAVRAGAVEQVFVTPERSRRSEALLAETTAGGTRVDEVSPEVMARLASTVTPSGIVAVARFVDVGMDAVARRPPAGAQPFVSMLVRVRDPGNAGAVLRSTDAAGGAAMVVSEESVDVYNAKTIRASAGSLFHVPVVREALPEDAVDRLRGAGFRILAADVDGRRDLDAADLSGPVAFLFGNEARGLGSLEAAADETVRIPMAGAAESLNLAAAAAVLLFECARRRRPGRA